MGLIGKLFGKDDHTISLLNNIIDIQAEQIRNFEELQGIALDLDAQVSDMDYWASDLRKRIENALMAILNAPSWKRMNKNDQRAILNALTDKPGGESHEG
jgi:hypothetical protein